MTSNLEAMTGLDAPTRLLIGGQWGTGRAGLLPVIDPATEEPVAEVANASAEDALEAVAAASAALPKWAATAPRERGECLRRGYQLMTERAEALARLMVVENGKALRDARGEIAYAAEFFRWYAEEAVRNEGSLMTAPSGTNRIMVSRQPVGVSVLVTPWNFPAAMATRKIGPALAAGCTVVLKPAKETPLSAMAIASLLREAGLPDGVVNVVPTTAPGPVVSAMLGDPRVRKLSFTGSTEVGKLVMRAASDRIVPVSLELGGKSPSIVFPDANEDWVIDGIIAAMRFTRQSQSCTAGSRLFLHRDIFDKFLDALGQKVRALKDAAARSRSIVHAL